MGDFSLTLITSCDVAEKYTLVILELSLVHVCVCVCDPPSLVVRYNDVASLFFFSFFLFLFFLHALSG